MSAWKQQLFFKFCFYPWCRNVRGYERTSNNFSKLVKRAAVQFFARQLIPHEPSRRLRPLIMSGNNPNLLRECNRSKDTRVRAPNEPRIIATPFYDAPLAYRQDLRVSTIAIAKGATLIPTDTLRAENTRVYSEASAWRYADLARRRDNRRTMRYTNRASRGMLKWRCLGSISRT